MFIPLICSERVYTKTIPTPEGQPEAPSNIICPHCNEAVEGEYINDVYRCDICFICCVPCGSSLPYVACKKCQLALGRVQQHKCKNCEVDVTYQSTYCCNCGVKK